MDDLIEARRPKPFFPHYIEYSPLWLSREVTDLIDRRVQQIVDFYTRKKRLLGVDKESLSPYPPDYRHSHASLRRLDPIIMYIAQTTHAEAFRGNEANFIQIIKPDCINSGIDRRDRFTDERQHGRRRISAM